jgi:polysaccharide pyruvyl transferase WcaK-like protein
LNLLVYGGWFGSGNLGDEAILQGVNKIFTEKIPEARLIALSTNPRYTFEQTGVRAVQIESPKTFVYNMNRYLKLFRKADAHILSGGTPFYDYSHLSRLIHIGLPALNNRKVFCFGVGCKPINTLKGRKITSLMLKNTEMISTRDTPSKQILQSLFNSKSQPITVTGDSSLMLNPAKVRRENELVLFCPRRLNENHRILYHQKVDDATINKIRILQANLADQLIEEGYKVSFIPFHCVLPDDDREEINEICKLMRHNAELLPRPKNTNEALEVIGRADLLMGLRLHSLILASLQGTPFVSINYDIKIKGFMRHMFGSDYFIEVNQELNELYDKAKLIINNQKEISKDLTKRVNTLKKLIGFEADRLVSTIT